MRYVSSLSCALVLCLSGSYVSAFGYLSAGEVRALITGNTVEGERRQGVKGGQGEPGLVNGYVEYFAMFFAKNGKVKRLIGEQHKSGEWRVTESGALCLEWKGRKERCAPVYKDGNAYKTVTKKPTGRVRWEIKFTRFTPGNKYDL